MTESLKQCSRCNEWLPTTSDYFHKRSDRKKTPWCAACKKCLNKLPVVKLSELIASDGHKRCRKCRREKPATSEFFAPRKQGTDGFASHCKVCASARKREYRRENRDEINSQKTIYYEANKDRILRERREQYKQNPEKYKEINRRQYRLHKSLRLTQAREYRDKNRHQIRQASREYEKRNAIGRFLAAQQWRKDNAARTRVFSHNRRARKRALPSTLTAAEWQSAIDYFGGACAACGRPPGLFHTLAMDHWIPLSSPNCPGTVVENMIPLCGGQLGCNNQKSNKPAAQWLEHQFGKRKAKTILAKIEAYFASVK